MFFTLRIIMKALTDSYHILVLKKAIIIKCLTILLKYTMKLLAEIRI